MKTLLYCLRTLKLNQGLHSVCGLMATSGLINSEGSKRDVAGSPCAWASSLKIFLVGGKLQGTVKTQFPKHWPNTGAFEISRLNFHWPHRGQ